VSAELAPEPGFGGAAAPAEAALHDNASVAAEIANTKMRDEADKGPSSQLTVDDLQCGMTRIENYRQKKQTTTTVGNRFGSHAARLPGLN
jgi:hypothetical protein